MYKISYKDAIHSQRKVFQTSGSYAGARYTGKIFSIIQTCLINNVNVEKYLNYLLNNLNRKPIEELLPYSKEIRKMKWWVELSMALFGGLYQKYDSVYYAESYFFYNRCWILTCTMKFDNLILINNNKILKI